GTRTRGRTARTSLPPTGRTSPPPPRADRRPARTGATRAPPPARASGATPGAGRCAERAARTTARRSCARWSSDHAHELVEDLVGDVHRLRRRLEGALVAEEVAELLVKVDARERLTLILQLLLERLAGLRGVPRPRRAFAHRPGQVCEIAAEGGFAERRL